MKIVIAAVLAFSLCLAGHAAPDEQAKTVGNLLGQRYGLRWACSSFRIQNGMIKDWDFELHAYEKALAKVEIGNAPDAFKVAWLEYLEAVHKWSSSVPGLISQVSLQKLAPEKRILPAEISHLVYKTEPVEVRLAWENLEKAASQYVGFEAYMPKL